MFNFAVEELLAKLFLTLKIDFLCVYMLVSKSLFNLLDYILYLLPPVKGWGLENLHHYHPKQVIKVDYGLLDISL